MSDYESRQSRSGENSQRFCETNPIFELFRLQQSESEEAAASIIDPKSGDPAAAQLATQVIRSTVKAVDAEFIDEDGGCAAHFLCEKAI